MPKVEVKVIFNTITPLWTGDAWQESEDIRPSSLIGSLRFWFAFYWKAIKGGITEKLDNGVPKESLQELETKERNFRNLLVEYIEKTNSFDEAVDKALNELGLSVPSRIFGCTGFKSRVKIEIEDFEKEYINFNNLEFKFPLNRLQQIGTQHNKQLNTKFWIRKILFNDKTSNPLELFKNVKIKLITTGYWWDKYLKEFFEYFKNKLILVGGKNSFGFGFVHLSLENKDTPSISLLPIDDLSKLEKIEKINYKNSKEILGFNFKYYLRKKEKKKHRKTNFGEQGKASKIYVSNLLKEDNNSVYLLLLNNPFDEDGRSVPQTVFEEYILWLKILSNQGDKNE